MGPGDHPWCVWCGDPGDPAGTGLVQGQGEGQGQGGEGGVQKQGGYGDDPVE